MSARFLARIFVALALCGQNRPARVESGQTSRGKGGEFDLGQKEENIATQGIQLDGNGQQVPPVAEWGCRTMLA